MMVRLSYLCLEPSNSRVRLETLPHWYAVVAGLPSEVATREEILELCGDFAAA